MRARFHYVHKKAIDSINGFFIMKIMLVPIYLFIISYMRSSSWTG